MRMERTSRTATDVHLAVTSPTRLRSNGSPERRQRDARGVLPDVRLRDVPGGIEVTRPDGVVRRLDATAGLDYAVA